MNGVLSSVASPPSPCSATRADKEDDEIGLRKEDAVRFIILWSSRRVGDRVSSNWSNVELDLEL